MGRSRGRAEALRGCYRWPAGSPAAAAERAGAPPRQPGGRQPAASAARTALRGAAATEHAQRWPGAAPGFQNEIPLLQVLATAARGAGAAAGVLLGAVISKSLSKTWE